MLEALSAARVLAFAVFFAAVEYFVVNRRESGPTATPADFGEKPLLGQFYPYHVFVVLPIFVAVSYDPLLTAWAGNVLMLALAEDALYFAWRRRWIGVGDWTAKTFGSFRVGEVSFPIWYPLALAAAVGLYALPF